MKKKSSWYTREKRRNICGTQVTQFEHPFAHMNGSMQKFWLEKFMFNRESDSQEMAGVVAEGEGDFKGRVEDREDEYQL